MQRNIEIVDRRPPRPLQRTGGRAAPRPIADVLEDALGELRARCDARARAEGRR